MKYGRTFAESMAIIDKKLEVNMDGRMTIEEIKEWRKHTLRVYGIHTDTLEVIDTLLAEVDELPADRRDCKQCAAESAARIAELEAEVVTLEKHNASSDQAVVELDQKLTVATEALKELSCDGWEDYEMLDYARTALERMKG